MITETDRSQQCHDYLLNKTKRRHCFVSVKISCYARVTRPRVTTRVQVRMQKQRTFIAGSSLVSLFFQHSGWIRESFELSYGRVLGLLNGVGGVIPEPERVELLLGRSGVARVLSNRGW